MEEQRTENESRVESDKQLFHKDLFFFLSLSMSHFPPTPHPLWRSFSLSFSSALFNYFVINIIFFSVVFVLSVNALTLSKSVYCCLCTLHFYMQYY